MIADATPEGLLGIWEDDFGSREARAVVSFEAGPERLYSCSSA